MDSRLDIILSTNADGNLVVVDRTNYAEWGTDVSNHTAIERLLDDACNVLETRAKALIDDESEENGP